MNVIDLETEKDIRFIESLVPEKAFGRLGPRARMELASAMLGGDFELLEGPEPSLSPPDLTVRTLREHLRLARMTESDPRYSLEDQGVRAYPF